jgi:hypothetical protein
MAAWKWQAAFGARPERARKYLTCCINDLLCDFTGMAAAAAIDGFVTCTPD